MIVTIFHIFKVAMLYEQSPATKGNFLKEEWIAYVCREILRVSLYLAIFHIQYFSLDIFMIKENIFFN